MKCKQNTGDPSVTPVSELRPTRGNGELSSLRPVPLRYPLRLIADIAARLVISQRLDAGKVEDFPAAASRALDLLDACWTAAEMRYKKLTRPPLGQPVDFKDAVKQITGKGLSEGRKLLEDYLGESAVEDANDLSNLLWEDDPDLNELLKQKRRDKELQRVKEIFKDWEKNGMCEVAVEAYQSGFNQWKNEDISQKRREAASSRKKKVDPA